MIETLEETKQNNELQLYITQKLDQMMIPYTLGHILKLGLTEKRQLKEMIENIESNLNKQKANEEKKEKEHQMHIFESDLMYGSTSNQSLLFPQGLGKGGQIHRFSSIQQKSKGMQLRKKMAMAQKQKSEKVMDLKSRDNQIYQQISD